MDYSKFRIFHNNPDTQKKIIETYKKNRRNQTVDYVEKMKKNYLTFNLKMTINEVLASLDNFIDISDPDINLENSIHAYQTAEALRRDKYPDWLQLVGLIHDLGKIIYLKGCDEDGTSMKEQWGIVGDTFIVGCKIPDCIVYPEFNKDNPDYHNPKYNTELGIYKKGCGLSSVSSSWGHDEYLYQVLKHNKVNLPEEALYIIRYHSLYSYHTENYYHQFINEYDKSMYRWLKLFNKYDLYTKEDTPVDVDSIKEYYNKLINKYIGDSKLYW